MADVKKSVSVAAEKWATMISDTSNLRNFDNGEKKNDIGFFMSIMGSLRAMEHTPTPEQVSLFKDTLEELIENELLSGRSHEVTLRVDYHPEGLLDMAAEKAGIDASVFPFKRTMWVTSTSVKFSDGCGEPEEVLYAEDQAE